MPPLGSPMSAAGAWRELRFAAATQKTAMSRCSACLWNSDDVPKHRHGRKLGTSQPQFRLRHSSGLSSSFLPE
jgi:hypothetical protein